MYGFTCEAIAGAGIYVAPTTPGSWSSSTAIAYAVGSSIDIGGVPQSLRTAGSSPVTLAGVSSANPLATATYDPVTHIAQSITSFHSGDDQNVSGASGSALASGVAMLQNIAGTADNQRGTGADNASAIGIATSTTNPKNVGITTLTNGGGINIGATSVTLAATSATVNGVKWQARVGSVITFEPDTANEESFRIQSVIGSTITFKGASGSGCTIAHANGSVVAVDTYNVERDACGENDGGRGKGFVPSVEILYNGGAAQGTQNYDRPRTLQGEKEYVTYLGSAASSGAYSLSLNSATGLAVGTAIDIEDAINGNERVYVREDSSYGGTAPNTRTALQANHAAGGSTTLSGAASLGATTVPVTSITGAVSGQYAIINPGGQNAEIVVLGTPNTTMPITNALGAAGLLRAHASGETVIYGPLVSYDGFDLFGPQYGIMGSGGEEGFVAAVWDSSSKSPRLLTSASQNAAGGAPPSNTLLVAAGVYDTATDTIIRQYSAASVADSATGTRHASVSPGLYNGSTWDKQRNNMDGTALASALRTSTAQSSDIVNYNGRGMLVVINVTAASGTGGLVLRLAVKDPASGNYIYFNSAPTAVTATGSYAYIFYPGNNTGGTQSWGTAIPRTFALVVGHNDASNYTYSVGYSLIL